MKRPAGRAVAVSNGALAVLLVVVLAGVALVANPPAPPGIAEFAPQATKPISKAPLGQFGQHGGPGRSGCADAVACSPSARPSASTGTGGVPLPKPTGVAGPLQCYSWPDGSITQTFDPQSPPCIASWDSAKGNGGATARGVSASDIRVAVPGGTQLTALQKATVDFVNTRFMLYNRKIRLIPVDDSEAFSGPQGDATPSGYRAIARKVIAQKAFASTTGILEPEVQPFVEELAGDKVLSVTGAVSYLTSAQQERFSPYSWGYLGGADTAERNLAALACSALVGRPAEHGGVDVRGKTRKFAVVLYDGDTLDTKPLTDGLASCGSPARVVTINPQVPGDPGTTQQFLALKRAGYTSLITPHWGWSTNDAQFASNAGYTPEWLILGIGDQSAEGSFTYQKNAQQLANAYGLGTWNKSLPWSLDPWYLVAGAGGSQPAPSPAMQQTGQDFYHSLLLLASGIQMAGPHLTAQAFAEGLKSTTFANPGAGAAPSWQGSVGFESGHAMVRDMALVWWNESARDYSSSPGGTQGGGWCYLAGGRRFTLGTWPRSDPPMNKSGPCP